MIAAEINVCLCSYNDLFWLYFINNELLLLYCESVLLLACYIFIIKRFKHHLYRQTKIKGRKNWGNQYFSRGEKTKTAKSALTWKSSSLRTVFPPPFTASARSTLTPAGVTGNVTRDHRHTQCKRHNSVFIDLIIGYAFPIYEMSHLYTWKNHLIFV